MQILAAADDTWGISGSTFLTLYLTLALCVLVFAIVRRSLVLRGRDDNRARDLSPSEVGYLANGPTGAVLTTLSTLHSAGSIRAERGQLSLAGPMPVGTDSLGQAVYNAAPGQSMKTLRTHTHVRQALDSLRGDLARRGLVLDADERAQARLGGLLMLAVTGFGVARIVAGLSNNRAIGFISLMTALTFVAGLMLLQIPPRTKAGSRMLSRLREIHSNLSPSQHPAWSM